MQTTPETRKGRVTSATLPMQTSADCAPGAAARQPAAHLTPRHRRSLSDSDSDAIIHAEFSGAVVDFRADGWIFATPIAEQHGKRLDNWLTSKDVNEYLAALHRANSLKNGEFVRTVAGRNGGTWLHPKLALLFARWINADFAVWCDLQIERLLMARHEHQSPDWQQARREVASEFRHVAEMLLDVRRDAGKDTAAHHFINEARLIRHAMTGDAAQHLRRDLLTRAELRLLGQVERLDMRLIARGTPYADRKIACRAHVLAQKAALTSHLQVRA